MAAAHGGVATPGAASGVAGGGGRSAAHDECRLVLSELQKRALQREWHVQCIVEAYACTCSASRM